MDFGEKVNLLAESFPKREIYNLVSQISRAFDSIALNVSEGSIAQSKAEFNRFLGYFVRSIAQVVAGVYKAKHRNCIN